MATKSVGRRASILAQGLNEIAEFEAGKHSLMTRKVLLTVPVASHTTKVTKAKRNSKKIFGTVVLRTNIGKIVRETGLTQKEFGGVLGISLKTLRDWIQGKRKPNTAITVLLHLIARDKEGFAKEVQRFRENKK